MTSAKDKLLKRMTPMNKERLKNLNERRGNRRPNEDLTVNGKYVPRIFEDDLDPKTFKKKGLVLRILPQLKADPRADTDDNDLFFKVYEYYISILGGDPIRLHSPRTLPGGKDPIWDFRNWLWDEDGSEAATNFAQKFKARPQFYFRVLIREIPLEDENGDTVMCYNVPRILRCPTAVCDKIFEEIREGQEDKDIGDPLDLENGRDFLYRVSKKKDGKSTFPNYDKCKFLPNSSPVVDPDKVDEDKFFEELLEWLPDLSKEYVAPDPAELKRVRDALKAEYKRICSVEGDDDDDDIDDDDDDDIKESRTSKTEKKDGKKKDETLRQSRRRSQSKTKDDDDDTDTSDDSDDDDDIDLDKDDSASDKKSSKKVDDDDDDDLFDEDSDSDDDDTDSDDSDSDDDDDSDSDDDDDSDSDDDDDTDSDDSDSDDDDDDDDDSDSDDDDLFDDDEDEFDKHLEESRKSQADKANKQTRKRTRKSE